jgi:hypothetical protein
MYSTKRWKNHLKRIISERFGDVFNDNLGEKA